jgi:oligoendopeptidase F
MHLKFNLLKSSFLRPLLGLLSLPIIMSPSLATEHEPIVWDLTPLFADLESWEKALEEIRPEIAALESFRDKVQKDPQQLLAYLDARSSVAMQLQRINAWAGLQVSADTRPAEVRERAARARNLYADWSRANSWYSPTVLQIGEDKIHHLLQTEPELAPYRRGLEYILRSGPHTYGEETEAAIALTSPLWRPTNSVYSVFMNADLPWPTITLESGEEVQIDVTTFTDKRRLPNREERSRIFETFWGALKQYESTMGELYYANVQAAVVQSKLRQHDSALAHNFFQDELPPEIYENLIEQVHSNLPSLHRYMKLRTRILGLDTLKYHDIYNPLIEWDPEFPYEKSVELFRKSTEVLGEEYNQHLDYGLNGNFSHVYPAPGKRSGAFMSGSVYDEHPYVFLNHTDNLNSATTLAHEWGHAIHSVLSNKNQPYPIARYSLFIAEIAAFTNEYLLSDYLQRNATDPLEKLTYWIHELERNRGAFYRQAKFAEFELKAHEWVEADMPLSGPRLTQWYGELLRQYYGHDADVIEIEDHHAIEWAMIPHFYNNFYVYNYATSIAAANYFATKILQGDEAVLQRYLILLKAGGSDTPHALLLAAGLDMKTDTPYTIMRNRMEAIMDNIEALIEEHPALLGR